MDPARKRHIRLVLALSAAVLLAVALIYTSFTAANEAIQPSELLAAEDAGTVVLTGKVANNSEQRTDGGVNFEMTDREGGDESVPVEYLGVIPDPFREGREVIVTGTLDESGVFMAEKDTLITKCPSKFKEEYGDDPNIQYES